ncbi:hypothetical protein [Nonlabens xiamenensis]|uniref:hypothetical protein n=1 Tax=Nonlabens xiamenensis TaxID=2341043 RepID=UPI000F60E373|nr:hypothetical protein [Nonlabens xiamenensis]
MKYQFSYRPIALVLNEEVLTAYEVAIKEGSISIVKEYSPKVTDNFHFYDTLLILKSKEIITEIVVSSNPQDALEEAFPAIRTTDIYFDYQSLNCNVISIIKKSYLKSLIDKHNLPKRYINHIRLAPSLTAISTSNQDFTDGELAEIGLGMRLKSVNGQSNLDALEKNFQEKLFNKRFFEVVKWSAITVFLVGLLINFFYHEQYRKELETVKISAQSFKNIDQKIQNLQEEVKANRLILNSDNSEDIELIRFLNSIMLFDEEIKFNTVEYQPLKSKIKVDQELRIQQNELILSGVTTSKILLNDYLAFLKEQDLISEVLVQSINEDAGKVDFKILVRLDETR